MRLFERECGDGYLEYFNNYKRWRSDPKELTAALHYYELQQSLKAVVIRARM